ncbi:hypothetical protein [Jannaschia sp. R86511]|uniref:hypothetical protein n=1 Tax=Jannaschia sp. R86511 TaxID=3093853 RepID=UPI0036D249CD
MTNSPSSAPAPDDVWVSVLRRTGVAAGAALALAIAWIHVIDQGGLLGLKDPAYLGWGFRALEVTAVVCAVLLLTGRHRVGWLLAAGVAAGPLLGIIVSRSVGLPNATEDIGNWGETIGVASMVVEAALLIVAAAALLTSSRSSVGREARVSTRSSSAPEAVSA